MAAVVQLQPSISTVSRLPNAPKPLTHLQYKTARLLATGKVKSEILEILKIKDQTFRKWSAAPYFKAEVARMHSAYLQECIEQAKTDVSTLGPEAMQCLRREMLKGGGPGVKAALAIAQSTGILTPVDNDQGGLIQVRFGRIEEDSAGIDTVNASPN